MEMDCACKGSIVIKITAELSRYGLAQLEEIPLEV